MNDDIDKSLLDRLQALRGSSATPEKPPAPPINIDVIERAKTPTREEALADRLRSLRDRTESPSAPASKAPPRPSAPTPIAAAQRGQPPRPEPADEDVDALFETDDRTLEELLGDVNAEEQPPQTTEPRDEDVRALLEELSRSVPKDDGTEAQDERRDREEDGGGDSDDSDGERMGREVDDVIARFRDEAEIEAKRAPEQDAQDEDADEQEAGTDDGPPEDLDLPSLPSNLDTLPSSSPPHASQPRTLDDLTARMAALRAPSSPSSDPSLSLPSVPTSKPAKGPKRLTTTTRYTDDDVDSWCTVCLEDATLRCLGCDDDPYCARCWREMHVGPAAGFDERSHRAVQFTRRKKSDKVAVGAS
ncbi:zinc finger, FYVE domain-containing protein [Purpureocillium lilacinum]|uniref:Zinc finger, FYVE domain-containing protein n=1 Tax=Purpureocillium lilacinum TaxID=33203 RepID=A0A179GFG5_PURLI|nr:zinc finger, FYVE domain-containing protein [Purpureocillium lilacinum]GJN75863.1 hypothetical protein PLICBS_009971 [Purpureocillium lilacinum]